jgi:hypothetical protein
VIERVESQEALDITPLAQREVVAGPVQDQGIMDLLIQVVAEAVCLVRGGCDGLIFQAGWQEDRDRWLRVMKVVMLRAEAF